MENFCVINISKDGTSLETQDEEILRTSVTEKAERIINLLLQQDINKNN